MKHFTTSPSYPSHDHRLAGLPLIYSPQSKTPFLYRVQASFWRLIFAGWSHLRLKHGRSMAGRPDIMVH